MPPLATAAMSPRRALAALRRHGSRSRWAAFATVLLLSQLLGGGCTYAYHTDHHDDGPNDQGGGTVVVTATTDGSGSGGNLQSADGAAPFGASAGAMSSDSITSGPLMLMLREVPDADGDGLPELAILAVDGGDAELPASAWIVSGAQGEVLETCDLGALNPLPASATASRAAPRIVPMTSARQASSPSPGAGRAPRRE